MTAGLGRAIREQREARGLSQTALAERAGVTRAHLSEVERGKIALPNADFRRRVANALGISHARLLVEAGELGADEIGDGGAVDRPPFPAADQRAEIVDLLHVLTREEHQRILLTVARTMAQEYRRAQTAGAPDAATSPPPRRSSA